MSDNFNFRKFITENKTGPYARLSEALDSKSKKVTASVETDRYGNVEGLYLYTDINGVESEYDLKADINNDDEWDVKGGMKMVKNEETPVSDQEVSALLNDEDIWKAVDKAFSKYERPREDEEQYEAFEESVIEEVVNPEMDNKVRRIVKAIAKENQTPLAAAAAAVIASIKRLESEFKDK